MGVFEAHLNELDLEGLLEMLEGMDPWPFWFLRGCGYSTSEAYGN